MLYALMALLGLCVGSFFNVVISRWGKEDGMLFGRSHCPLCNARLAWYDLVPLLSFIVLRGRCRSCGAKISWQYPIVELVAAGILVAFFFQYGFDLSPHTLWFAMLVIGFLALLLFDLIHLILPDVIIAIMSVITVGYLVFLNKSLLPSSLATGLLLSALFAILYVVSRGRWVGFGDVKLMFLVGVAFGYPFGVLTAIASIWLAAATGIAFIAAGKATGKSALPFGSFLAGVSVVYIIFFNEIQTFRWYF
ncbi:MAG: prepilin peptidase [Patescibacteria group bacterium]